MASIDLASNSALLQVAEKLAEQNSLLSAVAVRGERPFIRYSAYADGTDFTEKWSVGQNYIGHAVGHEAPTEKEGYEWSLFASNIRETLTVTLPVSGWSKNTQTFETSIIGDGSTVLPTPTPECMEAYVAAGVMLTAATETSLIFTCAEIPTIDLVVEVYVTAPMAVVGGGGGLGQSDWNAVEGEPGEILNKPFYDESISLGETVTWDYVLNENSIVVREETTESGELQQFCFHKVSTSLPAPEEFIGGSVSAEAMGQPQSIQIAENNIIQVSDKIFAISELMFVVTEDNAEFTSELSSDGSIIFPTKGIYFGAMLADGAPMMAINSLTIPGYNFEMDVIKKLDPKFVHTPDWEAKAGEPGEILNKPFYDESVSFGETVTWDGTLDLNNDVFVMEQNNETVTASAYFHYISSSTPTMEELLTGSYAINSNGTDQTVVIADKGCSADDKGIIIDLADNAFVVVPSDNLSMSFSSDMELVFPKKGIYVMWMEMTLHSNGTVNNGYLSSMTIPGYNFVMGAFKKLDSKFIPTPDWNVPAGAEGEILNRPFYDYTVDLGDTVTFDGEEVGENDLMGGAIHCLSHSIPTIEELQTGTVVLCNRDTNEETTIALADCTIAEESWGIYVSGSSVYIYVTLTDNAMMMDMLLTPKAGVYTNGTGMNTKFIKSLTIPGHNFKMSYFKKIDSKFIDTTNWDAVEGQPGYIENRPFGKFLGTSDTLSKDIGYGESVQIMGMDAFFHMSDATPTVEELQTGTLYLVDSMGMNGTPGEGPGDISPLVVNTDTDGIITIGMSKNAIPFIIVVQTAGTYIVMDESCVFNKTGIYFLNLMEQVYIKYLQIPGYEFPSVIIQPIDPKYLPEITQDNLVAEVKESLAKADTALQSFVESDPTVPAWAKEETKPTYTADEVGALPVAHNTATDAHNDIRELITGLTTRLNALADSDDTTLDQLSEIVTYIKSNKDLIDSITTGKVSTADIVNDLATDDAAKPLSAAQGVALKGMIDNTASLLPTITAEDEGKFLRIVNGQIALVALSDVSTEGV